MSSGDPLAIATAAAQGFAVFECQACADCVKKALTHAGHDGTLLEIRGKLRGDFMICLSYDGGGTTITQNGRHLAIRVGDIVFDNLHPNGMPYDSWLEDFDALGGIEL